MNRQATLKALKYSSTPERWSWKDWVRLKRAPYSRLSQAPTLRIVDLFSGCGGLSLGIQEACHRLGFNFDIALAADFSPEAIGVYRRNFKVSEEVALLCDVKKLLPGRIGAPLKFAEHGLRKKAGRVDLLVAGPPCQGHSNLNNVSRRDDPRNSLYMRVTRAAEVFRPELILIENVPSVIHDSTEVVSKTISRLTALNYSVWNGVISLANFGVAQTRKRHVLLASGSGVSSWEEVVSPVTITHSPLKEFIAGLENEPERHTGLFYRPSILSWQNQRRIEYLFKHRTYDLPNVWRPRCHQNHHSYKSMYGRMHWGKPAQTITSGFGSMGQGRFVHPLKRRTITAHEAARIQGFPDFFDFSDVNKLTSLREMIGNAVPPQLTAVLISRIYRGKP